MAISLNVLHSLFSELLGSQPKKVVTVAFRRSIEDLEEIKQ